jgi:hypothetical protein
MEISGSNSSAYSPVYDRSVTVSRVIGSTPSSQGASDDVYEMTTVQISPEAVSRNSYAADNNDQADSDTDGDIDSGNGTEDDSVQAADSDTVPVASEAAQTDDPQAPSTPKSFVYGALGLERPEHSGKPPDGYDFGRWVAAGVTIGTIISILV